MSMECRGLFCATIPRISKVVAFSDHNGCYLPIACPQPLLLGNGEDRRSGSEDGIM